MLCLLPLFLVFSVPGLADVSAAENASRTDAGSEQKPVQNKKEKSTETQRKKYEPAGRFTPTEKLRADDVVAFPVDI